MIQRCLYIHTKTIQTLNRKYLLNIINDTMVPERFITPLNKCEIKYT